MKNTYDIYTNLLFQYEKLTDLEKNAILVYKSKLFEVINAITKIPDYENLNALQIIGQLSNKDECINIFNNYSHVLGNLKNIFIRNTVFNNIRFDNFNNFVDDLKFVIKILNGITFKITLNEDLVVYRGILVDKNKKIDFVGDSSALISTSIKVEDAEKFLDSDVNKEKHFYNLKIPKGMPVIVSPFSVIRKYDSLVDSIQYNDNYSLAVSNRDTEGQQEVILFRDYISFNEVDSKVIDDSFGKIFIHYGDVCLKENLCFDDSMKINRY